MPRKPPESINRLTMAMQFQLMQFVQSDYTKSGLTDSAFAKEIEAKFQFPCSGANVQGARNALKIKSNMLAAREALHGDTTLISRVAALEADLRRLRDRVEVCITGCRGDR